MKKNILLHNPAMDYRKYINNANMLNQLVISLGDNKPVSILGKRCLSHIAKIKNISILYDDFKCLKK